MEELNRRQLLITATAAGAAGGAAIAASARASDGGDERPQLPETPEDYRFPLARTTPQIVRTGGSITAALPDNFPVLQDNQVSAGYLVLKPGALREPHWHPTHWEVDCVVPTRDELINEALANAGSTVTLIDNAAEYADRFEHPSCRCSPASGTFPGSIPRVAADDRDGLDHRQIRPPGASPAVRPGNR